MANSFKSIRPLGWQATISSWSDNVKWLKFSDKNITKFTGCTVTLNSDKTILTVTPINPTSLNINVVIGDILFDYESNTNENTERKATVLLRQNESDIIHQYFFIQSKDQLISTEYTNFYCQYKYHFENSPLTSVILNGITGDTIHVYSIVSELLITYQYIEKYQSSTNVDITYFKYEEKSNGRRLYSGTSESNYIELHNFDRYLEDVTKIFMRSEYSDAFFGFSCEQYEKQFTYSYSTSGNSYNITTSEPYGDEFTVNVGKNINETDQRSITVKGSKINDIQNVLSGITDDHYTSYSFRYIQENGYTKDIRRFILTFTKSVYDKPLNEIDGRTILSFKGNDDETYYIYKDSNGKTLVSTTYGTTLNSGWTSYINEGTRPYPEIPEDNVIKRDDTNKIYNVAYSGSVCTTLKNGWVNEGCSGQQEDCTSVRGMDVAPNSGDTTYQQEGYCYCNDINYVFSASTTGLSFGDTGETRSFSIASYSACNNNWHAYKTGMPQDPCVKTDEYIPNCPCTLLDNKITGTTYDNTITFDFEFDYNLLKSKNGEVISMTVTGSKNTLYGNIIVKNNLLSKKIELQTEIGAKVDLTILNWSVTNVASYTYACYITISANYSDSGETYNVDPFKYKLSFEGGSHYPYSSAKGVQFNFNPITIENEKRITSTVNGIMNFVPYEVALTTIPETDKYLINLGYGPFCNFITLCFRDIRLYKPDSNYPKITGSCHVYISDNGAMLERISSDSPKLTIRNITFTYLNSDGIYMKENYMGDDYTIEITNAKKLIGQNDKTFNIDPNDSSLFKQVTIDKNRLPSQDILGNYKEIMITAGMSLDDNPSYRLYVD